jgi:hypothetical protein
MARRDDRPPGIREKPGPGQVHPLRTGTPRSADDTSSARALSVDIVCRGDSEWGATRRRRSLERLDHSHAEDESGHKCPEPQSCDRDR